MTSAQQLYPTSQRPPDRDDKAASQRRPYTSPRLDVFGNLRGLTFGATGLNPDSPTGTFLRFSMAPQGREPFQDIP